MTDQGAAARQSRSSSRPAVEARRSGIPGEAEFIGRGVSWCATCDGALYRGRTVAVVGGGDSAVEEGMFLTKFADKVYLVHRRDELRAAPIAQERAFANPKFEFVWDSVPRKIDGDQMVEALEVENVKTREMRTLPVNGVFMYIGQLPNTTWLKDIVDLDEPGLHRHRRAAAHQAPRRVRLRRRPRQPAQADRHGHRRGRPGRRAGGALSRRARLPGARRPARPRSAAGGSAAAPA